MAKNSEEYKKYKNYIKTKAFKEVRELCLKRDNNMCMVCGRTEENGVKLACHHRVYKHLYCGGEEEAQDCITLCQYCHLGVHRMPTNYKWFSIDNERNKI